jgi:glycosyltransferase involved in cell wall biosynthesis
MTFKIVCAGWNCAEWFERTLRSVESQSIEDWDVWITYDPSDDDGAERIAAWCDARDDRWNYTINTERKFAIRNHYESITKLDPAADDVVVFLDLDGDMLAHRDVLFRLAQAYADGALVTYGQYKPIPDEGTSSFAKPYPADVVGRNAYREHHRRGGDTCFNHLRTMSGRVFRGIPESMLKWQTTGGTSTPNGRFRWQAGEWYQGSTDYVFMISALELAGGRYHVFDEVLLHYNHANPLADNKTHPHEAHVCITDFFRRAPLAPLVGV